MVWLTVDHRECGDATCCRWVDTDAHWYLVKQSEQQQGNHGYSTQATS